MKQLPPSIWLHACFSPVLLEAAAKPALLQTSLVAVIDVLRASTTICTALHNGAQAVVPFAELLDAKSHYAALTPAEQASVLLGGERGSTKPDGFHCGNSPREYTHERVSGKTVLFTTTNGTHALQAANHAQARCIASIVNAQAAARWMMQEVQRLGCASIILLCAGSEGDFTYEDALCAGLLVESLEAANEWLAYQRSDYDERAAEYAPPPMPVLTRSDAAQAANELYHVAEPHWYARLHGTHHGRSLTALGFGSDIDVAMVKNSLNVVPVMHQGRLVAANSLAAERLTSTQPTF
jgi:2-phosphosulfolactate phosphatase